MSTYISWRIFWARQRQGQGLGTDREVTISSTQPILVFSTQDCSNDCSIPIAPRVTHDGCECAHLVDWSTGVTVTSAPTCGFGAGLMFMILHESLHHTDELGAFCSIFTKPEQAVHHSFTQMM